MIETLKAIGDFCAERIWIVFHILIQAFLVAVSYHLFHHGYIFLGAVVGITAIYDFLCTLFG